MSITGNWAFTSKSPMGNDAGTFALSADNAALTGSITGGDGTTEIFDGSVAGKTATFKANINKPMPIVLEFSLELADDTLSGIIKLGAFGESTVTATRA